MSASSQNSLVNTILLCSVCRTEPKRPNASWENEFCWLLSSVDGLIREECPIHRKGFKKQRACLHKNMYKNVHSSFICSSQRLEIAQMFFNRGVVKRTVVRPWYYSALRGMGGRYIQQRGRVSRGITPSERNWLQKVTYCVIPLTKHLRLTKL